MRKIAAVFLLLSLVSFSMTGLSAANEVTLRNEAGEEGPVVQFVKIAEPYELPSMASSALDQGAPYTIMCNTFVMEQEDWDNQVCSRQYDVRANVPIVWGAYLSIYCTSTVRVQFRLIIQGPEPHTWSEWYPEAVESGYYVAIVKGGKHAAPGTYSASLSLWPEGGRATIQSREFSNYIVVAE